MGKGLGCDKAHNLFRKREKIFCRKRTQRKQRIIYHEPHEILEKGKGKGWCAGLAGN